ncbi:penicillin-binding protein 1A [Marinobacter nauticus]|uniref:penicillin-binding protein 1A n=1 Tax=Marinobacter nauticus TaxID=2743 RepID=UPI001C99678E|nr:penicillin-binding protein 1A [Marinobacter nauticus]MBY5938723.1 penicillin-binding protein 1A [Marinobacter nauticus]MBY5955952.1 penicillin-binding protein 1A [Marinobacter nauticus]MBY6009743.1 penicillin-binding protein 1A [Marinobacter nauticus]
MSHLLRTSRVFAWFFLTGLSVAIIISSSLYLYLRPNLPPVEQLLDVRLQTPLRVYSKDNRLIAEFGEKRRAPITIEQIPTIQLQAFLAAEDARFYEHFGVDIKGLTRAAVELITTGEIQSGGSTITMQVAKNYFLSRDRTFIRKFNEILLALQIERELDKNRILELYLNKIYLGNRAYGIAAAAQVYYDKPVTELSLAQMAMLAGLPKAPSAYNPLANPERALIRRNWILGRMKDLGYITEDAWSLASKAPLTASYNTRDAEVDADYVAEMARAEMVRRYGENAYTDGYSVTLTVDSDQQQTATEALRAGLEAYDRRHGFRGPIGQFDIEGLTPAELSDKMQNYPRVETLVPAVVTSIDDEKNEVKVHARRLGPGVMPFETMTWARRFRTESITGPEPEKPSDVVNPGEVIYVKVDQLPQIKDSEAESGSESAPTQAVTELRVSLAQAPRIEGALISLEAKTGAIEALAGGYSFNQSKYNRATQASRQPGSTFKPFLYLSALENGRTPATIYNDAPIVFEDSELETAWRPQNSSGQFYGPTTLREGLYRSRNLVSIRLLRDLGINTTLSYLKQLKLPTENMPSNLSLSLGSGLLTPMELARGFAVIANGGYDVQPYLIERIEEWDGTVVYEAPKTILCDENCDASQTQFADAEQSTSEQPPEIEGMTLPASAAEENTTEPRIMQRLADERSIYIMHSMMQDVVRRGTGRRALALNRSDIAGKTGTTNEQKDTWFAGFNHDIATTVWVGFDQPSPLGRGEYGASTALPIWVDYMKVALADQPAATMPRPNGIVNIRINPETGERARPGEEAVFEIFKEEDAPSPLPAESIGGNGDNGNGDDLSRQIF